MCRILVLLLLLLLLLLTACKQKDETCKETAYLIPANIVFQGFNRSELDTIIESKYAPDRTFSKFIAADTLIYTDSAKGPFLTIDENADVVIFLPSLSKNYFLHAAYAPPQTYVWTDVGCGSGRTFVQGPDTVFVNNNFFLDTTGYDNVYIQP